MEHYYKWFTISNILIGTINIGFTRTTIIYFELLLGRNPVQFGHKILCFLRRMQFMIIVFFQEGRNMNSGGTSFVFWRIINWRKCILAIIIHCERKIKKKHQTKKIGKFTEQNITNKSPRHKINLKTSRNKQSIPM